MDDALLTVGPDGRLLAVEPAPPGCTVAVTAPGAVWMPGFVDTHLHYPQTRIIGSAHGPLLEWLDRAVFPEEMKFYDEGYASAVAEEFCGSLVRHGTTTSSIYGSSAPGATDLLFAHLDWAGLRADVGLTLMDRGAPRGVCVPATMALEASAHFVETWHGRDDRLRFSVTPRFALSCTSELMRGAGDLAQRHGLPVQTHISENEAEIEATAQAFPESADYLSVYADHGLIGPKTLLAHCVWFDDGVWDRVAEAGCAVTHCPDSNFFLGSGAMRLAAPEARGIRVGLGTDVGAGRTFSVPRIAASAYDAARITESPTDAERLLWYATTGGAVALGLDRVGRLEPGFAADLVAIDVPDWLRAEPTQRLFETLIFCHDAGPVRHTVVAGRMLR
jgi:guanine deaminase